MGSCRAWRCRYRTIKTGAIPMTFVDDLLDFLRKLSGAPRQTDSSDGATSAPPSNPPAVPISKAPLQAPRHTEKQPVQPPAPSPTPPARASAPENPTPLASTAKVKITTTTLTHAERRKRASAQPQTDPEYCPHGKRRREYCHICDPNGYRKNFGDWNSD